MVYIAKNITAEEFQQDVTYGQDGFPARRF